MNGPVDALAVKWPVRVLPAGHGQWRFIAGPRSGIGYRSKADAQEAGDIARAAALARMNAVGALAMLDSYRDVPCTWGRNHDHHEIDEARAALTGLIAAATRANGPHFAPDDCYATGPLTGDPIRDLVECPGCVLAAALARIGGAA